MSDVEELIRGPARWKRIVRRAGNEIGLGEVCISLDGLDAKPATVLDLVVRALS